MTDRVEKTFWFGEYELNCEKRRLLKHGEPVALKPKAFDLLSALVVSHGRTVTKLELLNTVWDGQFVEENNLTVHISALRKIFGDTADTKRFISTVPGKGYRFVANVVEDSDQSEIVVEQRSVSRIVVEEIGFMDGEAGPPRLYEGARKPFWSRMAVFTLVAVGAIAAIGAMVVQNKLGSRNKPFRDLSTKRLTNNGDVQNAALSPDGRFFVYSVGTPTSLRLGQTNGGEEIELIPPSEVNFRTLAFSPEGDMIYYVVSGKAHPGGSLFKIRSLGGVPQKLRGNVRTHVAFSPDMSRFVYIGNTEDGDRSAIFVADSNSDSKTEIAVRPKKFPFASPTLAWSRDGKTIGVAALSDKVNGVNYEIFLIDALNGQVRELTDKKFRSVNGLEWLTDGTGLIVTAAEPTQTNASMWHVSVSDGTARAIDASLTNFGSPLDLSQDSGVILTVTTDAITNIWRADADRPEQARQITNSSFGGAFARTGMVWLTSGRIVMTGHDKGGGTPLWITDPDGATLSQLTPDGSIDQNPTATADGRFVVFDSNRSGASEVWRIDLSTNELTQITYSGYNSQPSVAPDGKWVVYISETDGENTIWRVPLTGGPAEKIAKNKASWARVSPDSRSIACAYEINGKTKLAVLSIDGGEPVKEFDLPNRANLRYSLRWTPDARSLTYRDWDAGYWRQSIDGGEPQRLAGFPDEKLFSYDWSPDGKQVAYGRGMEVRDIILVRDLNR